MPAVLKIEFTTEVIDRFVVVAWVTDRLATPITEVAEVPVAETKVIVPGLNIWLAVQVTEEAAVTKPGPLVNQARLEGIVTCMLFPEGLEMFQEVAPVEVVNVKDGPVTVAPLTAIVVVAGAEEMYPGLVQENAIFCPEVE